MKLYRYETHLHTAPVSKCAKASAEESLAFYKNLGYDGVFVTNHFIDGNLNMDRHAPYEDRIHFYFSGCEEALSLADKIGIKVFCGVECSYIGTDFLVYGLNKDWFLSRPEIEMMPKTELFRLMHEDGAFIVQAHPYREASYIDHIRLFPRSVDAVEVINAAMGEPTSPVNSMARIYADAYGLPHFAGSDNHTAHAVARLAGMETHTPLESVFDLKEQMKENLLHTFYMKNPLRADLP